MRRPQWIKRRFWIAVASAIVCVAMLASCGNGFTPLAVPPTTSNLAISVSTNQTTTPLVDDEFGLSFEAKAVAEPQFSTGNLAQYMKALGPGVLRVGGNSSDLAFWTSTNEKAPSWATSTLTPATLNGLANVAKKSGWKVIFGVNLKHYDSDRAADEVQQLSQALGSSLQAVAIGNEPNVYYPDDNKFWTDFSAYVAAIHAKVPNVSIAGPELESNTNAQKFMADFVAHNQQTKLVDELTQHIYPTTACSGKTATESQLLDVKAYNAVKKQASDLVGDATKLKAAALIDETNSTSCGGQSGVSDTYEAAVWAVAHGMSIASQGVAGVYFHGAIGQCGDIKTGFNFYTPFCAASPADEKKGILRPQPLYYGLLALGHVATGTFVGVANPDGVLMHAFAVKSGSHMQLVLVNEADPAHAGSTSVKVTFDAAFSHATEIRLQSREAAFNAQVGSTFGGVAITKLGTIPSVHAEQLKLDGRSTTVAVPPGSATIVDFS